MKNLVGVIMIMKDMNVSKRIINTSSFQPTPGLSS